MRQGQIGHLVCDLEAVFSGLNAKRLVPFILLLFVPAKELRGEHAVHLRLCEDSVSTNVLVGVVAQAVTIHSLNDPGVFVGIKLMSGGGRLWFSRILTFWELGKVIFALHVSHLNFLSFGLTVESSLESVQQSSLYVLLNLWDHLTTVNEEEVSGRRPELLSDVGLLSIGGGSKRPPYGVPEILGVEFSHLGSCHERVYHLLLLDLKKSIHLWLL